MKYNRLVPTSSRSVRWRLAVVVGVMLLVVGGSAVVWQWQSPPVAPKAVVQAVKPLGMHTKLQFVGDVFWGRHVETSMTASGRGSAYLTHGLTSADRANYDAWIANFECPITNKPVPYSEQVAILRFNCGPQHLAELAKWFTAVTLANNHTANNGGNAGLEETRHNLQQQGIQHFGGYDMTQTDDICEVVTVPARLEGSETKTAMPIALCGYMYVVDATPTDAALQVMQRYAKVMPVIAMPHMGIEYRPVAEQAKVDAYHRMIDNGADAVIGAHPHVIQNSESYRGKLIAYSEGNFLFDQQSLGRATSLGLGVVLDLTVPYGAPAAAYRKVATTCQQYKDDCLVQLERAGIRRPPIKVAYDFTCYDETAGVPEKGSVSDCKEAQAAATTDKLSGLATRW